MNRGNSQAAVTSRTIGTLALGIIVGSKTGSAHMGSTGTAMLGILAPGSGSLGTVVTGAAGWNIHHTVTFVDYYAIFKGGIVAACAGNIPGGMKLGEICAVSRCVSGVTSSTINLGTGLKSGYLVRVSSAGLGVAVCTILLLVGYSLLNFRPGALVACIAVVRLACRVLVQRVFHTQGRVVALLAIRSDWCSVQGGNIPVARNLVTVRSIVTVTAFIGIKHLVIM